MNSTTIINTLKTIGIKSELITTRFGYKMALVKLNSKITYPQILEVVAKSDLNSTVEVKQIGKQVMVYIPQGKE